jgi:hypothetical protein
VAQGHADGGGVNLGDFLRFITSEEDLRMDAHFSEYLATVWAMQEIYGERAEDVPTEFHREAERHNETGACQECVGV